MQKPTVRALATFDAAFPTDARAIRKQMFGMPAGFVNGNMFIGVWGDGVVLRVDEATHKKLSAEPGVGSFEPMEGRPWKDYVHLSADRWSDGPEIGQWAKKALDHTAKMPAKTKPAKAKGGKAGAAKKTPAKKAPAKKAPKR